MNGPNSAKKKRKRARGGRASARRPGPGWRGSRPGSSSTRPPATPGRRRELVTISFMPDGTNVGGQSSNLFATLQRHVRLGRRPGRTSSSRRPRPGPADQPQLRGRRRQRRRAGLGRATSRATRASATSASAATTSATPTLATAYMPPPVNNFSIAGDFVQHRPDLQHRQDLRPVHRGGARDRPRPGPVPQHRRQRPRSTRPTTGSRPP